MSGTDKIALLLSGDDLRRLAGRSTPGRWQPGDPAQLDLTLLQILAWRTTAGFSRKPAGESIVTDYPAKTPRLLLDQELYEQAASRRRRLSRTCYLLA